MQNRDVFSFNISKIARHKLIKANFYFAADFQGVTAEKLSLITSLSESECREILIRIRTSAVPLPILAAQQLINESQERGISTGSNVLDKLFGGGIHFGRIHEFCGLPGTGKTQLCLQLSINCQLTCHENGERGEVIYLDTEGSFTTERLCEMIKAKIDAYHISTDELVAGIHYMRCTTFDFLLTKLNSLQQILISNSKIRLVIIDNIANPVRCKFDSNYKERNSILQQMVLDLRKLAKNSKLAVVMTNQMTTQVVDANSTYVIPALGAHWSHCACDRILLEYEKESKTWAAVLLKSPCRAFDKRMFLIKECGICDVG